MNKKIILILIPIVIAGTVYSTYSFQNYTAKEQQIVQLLEDQHALFDITNIRDLNYVEKNNSIILLNPKFALKPELGSFYDEVGVDKEPQKTVVIFPLFTSSAYAEPGFYTYYRGECSVECLTVKLNDDVRSEASGSGAQILKLLGYEIISDLHVAKNPAILKQYDKVILLHNEYVTQEEFDAITSHPKVLYLYPNALYGKVQLNEKQNTITLIRGHGFPDESIVNGFDWKYDNTPFEYDYGCMNMEFHKINNGIMLNCYPEHQLLISKSLLFAIKEF